MTNFVNKIKELLGIRLSATEAERHLDLIRDYIEVLPVYDGNDFVCFRNTVYEYGEMLLDIQSKLSRLDHNKDCEGYMAVVRAITLRQSIYYIHMANVRRHTIPGKKYVPVDIKVAFDVELKKDNTTYSQYMGSVKLLSDIDIRDELLLEHLFMTRDQDNISSLVAGSFVEDHPSQSVCWDETDDFFDIAVCHYGDRMFYVPENIKITFHDNGGVYSDCYQFLHHDGTFEVHEGKEHIMPGSKDSFEILGFMHDMSIRTQQNTISLPAGTFHEVDHGISFDMVSNNEYDITYF